jgi:hypothetical protein
MRGSCEDDPAAVIACDEHEAFAQASNAMRQSILSSLVVSRWIASRSLSSATRSRDPVARNAGEK